MTERRDLRREADTALRLARDAGEVVARVYATAFAVELKGPNDPVTAADREANELICAALAEAFPGDAILAEESVPEDPAAIAAITRQRRVWFVDPLDGTREFADRNGEFAVMIGLAVGGRAALGVLVMPATGEALVGVVGEGAFLIDASGARRSLAVSSVADPREATLVVSRSHRSPAFLAPIVDALGITRVVPCGSVGVKIARIATRAADVYIHAGSTMGAALGRPELRPQPGGGAKLWDACAPEAVLVAAGGRFTDTSGRPIDYASPTITLDGGILASNAALYDATLAALRRG